MTGRVGINLAGLTWYGGVNLYRDLAKEAALFLYPWKLPLGAMGDIGSERNESAMSPVDVGATTGNLRPGADYGSNHDFSAEYWRVEEKRFGSTVITAGDRTVRTVNKWPTTGTARTFGRYMTFAGTAATFAATYLQFTDDTTVLTIYTEATAGFDGGSGAANMYYDFVVAGGTIEVLDSGNTVRAERTSANNGTKLQYNFTDGILKIRRKSGVANTRLTAYIPYLRASDFTGVAFLVQAKNPVQWVCAMTCADDEWATFLNGTGTEDYDVGDTSATITLAANSDETVRMFFWKGVREVGVTVQKWPANGISFSLLAPGSGTFMPSLLADISAAHLPFMRMMDATTTNQNSHYLQYKAPASWLPTTSARYDGTICGSDMADFAVAAGLTRILVCVRHNWSAAAKVAWLKQIRDRLVSTGNSSIKIRFENTNEPWNTGFGQATDYLLMEEDDATEEYLHYVDEIHAIIEGLIAEYGAGWTDGFEVEAQWQTSISQGVWNAMKARTGASAVSLKDRIIASNGGFATGCYFGAAVQRSGHTDGAVGYTEVVAVATGGAGATKAEFTTRTHTLLVAAQAEAVARMQEITTMLTADGITHDQYEINWHEYEFDLLATRAANYQDAFWDYHRCTTSTQRATLVMDHITDAAAQCGLVSFFAGPGGLADRGSNYLDAYRQWCLLEMSGADATNTTPNWTAFIALTAVLNATTVPGGRVAFLLRGH